MGLHACYAGSGASAWDECHEIVCGVDHELCCVLCVHELCCVLCVAPLILCCAVLQWRATSNTKSILHTQVDFSDTRVANFGFCCRSLLRLLPTRALPAAQSHCLRPAPNHSLHTTTTPLQQVQRTSLACTNARGCIIIATQNSKDLCGIVFDGCVNLFFAIIT